MRVQESRKHFVLYYMAGFLIGILFANLQSRDYIASMGIFNEYFLNQYSAADIDMTEYLWYIMRIRLTPVLLIAALGCTRLKKGVAAAFLIWTGFSSGLLITSAVMKMGIRGIVLCLMAVIPHFVFYAAGYMILLWYLYRSPHVRWNLSKTAVFALFIAVGIILECYVNPILMELFIRTL